MPGHPKAGAFLTILPCLCTGGMAEAPPGHGDSNCDFFGFPFGGEGDAEQRQGRTPNPCYESKPRPLAFSTEDESLEREIS